MLKSELILCLVGLNLTANNYEKLFLGTIFGIVIATVGFSGIAKLLDGSVNKVKSTVQEQVKE